MACYFIEKKYSRGLKEGHEKFLGVKWKFFSKKVFRKFGPREFFPFPQTRSQVSAHG